MKKTILTIIISAATAMLLSSCGGGATNDSSSSNDTSLYEVTIGSQVWMTKNLNVDKFRNGDPIPHAKTNEEWEAAGDNKQPAWCYYDNDPANGEKYGKLYNWYTVNDSRGLAPKGYHVPSDVEWTTLTDFLGGENVAGGKMKSTGTQYWQSPNEAANNSSGFSGLPGGVCDYNGSFLGIGYKAFWWSSTEQAKSSAWSRGQYYDGGSLSRGSSDKFYGFPVRCLRD